MNRFADVFGVIILLFTWLAGIVLASGFWQTLFTFFPFYAWYLVVEKVMQHIGLI